MKRILLALACLAAASACFATNKQVVVSGTAQACFTILDPYTKVIIIQNPSTSTGSVSVSMDSAAPTATLGIILAPGQQLIITAVGTPGGSQPKNPKVILVSGAATINVSTDTTVST